MLSSLVPKTFRSLITSLVLLCAASLAHGQSATITVTPTLTAVTAPGAATEITVVQASGTPSAFSVYGPNQTRLSSLISGSTYRFTPQRGATLFAPGQLIGYVSIPTGSLSFTVRVSVAPKLVDPVFIGDSGSGGYPGLVPAPAAGDAAAGKFVKADGTFAVPTGASSDAASVAPVFNAVRSYNFVGDGSTSNDTAFTNLAAAVNALTQGTVNTQKVTPARVYFPGPSNGGGSTYNWSNTPNFTQPIELSCDQGVVLNYTGSGHSMEFGPSGLTSGTIQSGIYSVHGCTFTGGASMTEGLFFNKFIVEARVYENSFRNFGNATGATIDVRPYALWFDGDNYGAEVHDNTAWNDDNVARNFLRIKDNSDGNSQLAAYDNELANINGASGTACSSSSGIGFYVDGYASSVSNNNFACGWAPGIWIGSHGSFSTFLNNYGEVNTGGTGCFIQYGDPSTGSPSTFIDSVTVKQRYLNLHSNSSAFLMCPSTSSTGLVNSYVEAPALSNYPAIREVVQLNNNTGQTNNTFGQASASTAFTFPFIAKTNFTTAGSNIAPWTQVGNISAGKLNSVFDNFNRSNGGLGSSWTTITPLAAPQIASNQVSTSGSAQGAFWNANGFTPNQFSQFTVTTAASGSNFTEAWVRVQPNAQTAYACAAANNALDGIYKFSAGSSSAISSLGAINFSAGDVFRCEVNGSTITFYKNGISVATATDTAITFGAPGIDLSVGASLDNWSGGNLQPIAQLTTEQDWTVPQHFLGNGGTCTMSSATSCTLTVTQPTTNALTHCIATDQGVNHLSGSCGISGTTLTITAASSNSDTWAAFIF